MTPARTDEYRLGPLGAAVGKRLAAWDAARFGKRLWRGDASLWVTGPAAEISDRLGWLRLPESMPARIPAFRAFAEEIRAEGVERVVLLGMAGRASRPSSIKGRWRRSRASALIVLDSTHPAAVAAVERAIDIRRTLFVVSSKSGTTIEPCRSSAILGEGRADRRAPRRRFAAISDPGTPLQALARERGFRRAFEALPTSGAASRR